MEMMGSIPRSDVAGNIFHAYNRANAGGQLFATQKDYLAFEAIIIEAQKRFKVKIYAYCIMPNHWHFVIEPTCDGGMAEFFHWVTTTHVKRWHRAHNTLGGGHIYQGSYKSNLCESDEHFLRLVRYVERNALRAMIVPVAEQWRWGSAWSRLIGTPKGVAGVCLSEWPIEMPLDYRQILNEPQSSSELEAIRHALKRGAPLGSQMWCDEMVREYGLEKAVRPRGRPKKDP